MPDRLIHAFPTVFAPLLAFVGLGWTAVAGVVAGASGRGAALLGQVPPPETALGSWGGYVLSAGAVLVTLLQGWQQGRRKQEIEDRQAWIAEIARISREAGGLASKVESLEAQLAESRKLAAKAYVASKDAKATVDQINQQMGSTSDPQLPAGGAT